MANQGDVDRAYETAINEVDDIYTLRLMLQTGPCMNRLNETTARKILEKTNKISRGGIVNKLFVEWVDDSYKIGSRQTLIQDMSRAEQNEYVDTLYQIAKTEGQLVPKKTRNRAAEVYQTFKRECQRK